MAAGVRIDNCVGIYQLCYGHIRHRSNGLRKCNFLLDTIASDETGLCKSSTPTHFQLELTLRLIYLFDLQPSTNEQESNTEDDVDASNPNDFVRDTCPSDDGLDSTIEHMPLFSQRSRYYMLDHKIELGEMARLFFNDTGRYLFFLCFAIYLYGDLSIYAAAVAKTMRDVIW